MSYEIVIDDKNVREMLRRITKRSNEVDQKSRAYTALLSAIVLQDIADHFSKESGPDGRWKPWSERYRMRMEKLGKGGNKILQDNGTLRNAWTPANVRTVSDGIVWFNQTPYAKRHDMGGKGTPVRRFSWLSEFALNKISDQTAKFITEE